MNVDKTRELDLCTSCEICTVTCPVDAITMEYKDGQFLPDIDPERCIDCERCIDVCPGIDVKLYEGKNFEDWCTGANIACISAFTPDEELHKKATSGGTISQLVIDLLKTGKYEGAFVLAFDTFEKEPSRLTLAKNEEKVRKASKSKYIPASVHDVVKKLEEESDPNYVVVGTACQISGIRKFIDLKDIDEKGLLFLGLFCDKTLNFNLLNYFEDKFSKNEERLVKFDYRNKEKRGWPGDVKLYFDSGREKIVHREERIKIKEYFQLERCLYCLDKLNRTADISFGDCYIAGKEHPGRSSIVIRTEKGKEVWDEHSDVFEKEESSIESIKRVQGISKKKENLEFARALVDKEDFFDYDPSNYDQETVKELNRRRKMIEIGKKGDFQKLERALKKKKRNDYFKYVREGLKLGTGLTSYCIGDTFSTKSERELSRNSKGNVVIFGGGFANKGAQAMVFTVVDQIKRRFPDKNIYLINSSVYKRDKAEKDRFDFEILPWDPGTSINMLKGERVMNLDTITSSKEIENRLKRVFANTDMFLDISGYHFSSQMAAKEYDLAPGMRSVSLPLSVGQFLYLIRIMLAKKYSAPYFILPQSIGPFDYGVVDKLTLYPLMKSYLKYPTRIYAREPQGIKYLKPFTENNVKRERDFVLVNDGYELSNIFRKDFSLKSFDIQSNSVGIVPNKQVMKRQDEKTVYRLYEHIIKRLKEGDKTVYILMHSEEDRKICEKIKRFFPKDEQVILIEEVLNAIELEKTMTQFDFIVASRYHSVINSYRYGVPAVVLGWSLKYKELLEDFDQLNYIFDVRENIVKEDIERAIIKMMKDHKKESEKIRNRLGSMQKNAVFDAIEELFSG